MTHPLLEIPELTRLELGGGLVRIPDQQDVPFSPRVRAVVERAGASDAECSHRAADGRSCLPRVQREYMRRHRG